MNAERPLVEWARRVGADCHSPRRLREKLQSALEPMVRCALKTGMGQPPLVRWVQTRLPALAGSDGTADRSRLACQLAGELCETLLARLDPLPGRETVPGL